MVGFLLDKDKMSAIAQRKDNFVTVSFAKHFEFVYCHVWNGNIYVTVFDKFVDDIVVIF